MRQVKREVFVPPTGEGIFFSSKMFDTSDIRSGNLHYMHDAGQLDLLMPAHMTKAVAAMVSRAKAKE